MRSESVKGGAQKAVGAAKEGIGKATGSKKLRAEGMADKAAGAAKKSVGKAKSRLNKATR